MKINKLVKRITASLAALCLCGAVTARAENAPAPGEDGLAAFKTVGSIVTFGHYEQDNDTSNGPEDIEWLVLDVSGDKALLLSRFGLDSQPYNRHYESMTWEICSLRRWLNSEFLNDAFSEEERSAILLTDVDNSASQGFSEWDTDGGNNTQDMIFLLSYAEANRYLDVTPDNDSNFKSRVAPTPYAIARGASINHQWITADGLDAGRWWLRSPGRHQYRAAHVWGAGSLRSTHVSADHTHYGGGTVRPAFWLNLDADILIQNH